MLRPLHKAVTRIFSVIAIVLLSQLVVLKASAAVLPTLSFSCTLGMTGTSTCTSAGGDYATFGTSSTNYWQYTVSTTGYSNIAMTFNTSSSGTGPTTGQVWYSTGPCSPFVYSGISYSVSTGCSLEGFVLPAACNNVALLTVQLRMSGGSGTAGTNRVTATGGFQGTLTTYPSVAISSTSPPTGTIMSGTTNNVLQTYNLATTSAAATLSSLTIVTAGTYATSDITNLKCWYSTSPVFNAATATLLSTYTSPGTAGSSIAFPSFVSQTIAAGVTGYVFITTDVAAAATPGHTIYLASNSFCNFGLGTATLTGTNPVAGSNVQTIVAGTCSGTPNAGTVTASPTSFCGSGSSTLTLVGGSSGGGISYQWSSSTTNTPPGTAITGAVSSTYTTPTISSTTYYWCTTTCSSSGLTNISSVGVVTVNPTPSAISGILNVCTALTSTLSDALTGGTWLSSSTSVATVGVSSGVVTGAASGTTTITYTSPAGCTTSSVVTVSPQPSSISGTLILCSNTATTLSNSVTGGTWTSGSTGIATVGTSSGVVSGVSGGTSLITYATTWCTPVTAQVTVNPISPITGSTGICTGTAVTLSDAVTGGSWSSSNTSIAVAGSSSGIITGITTGTAVISYVLPTGCMATTIVTVNSLAPITGSLTLCVGSTSTLDNIITGGTWSATPTSVITITPTTGIVTGVSAGVGSVVYTSPAGCVANATVLVQPLPAAITGTASVCSGATTTLHDATAGGTWASSNTSIGTIGSASGVVTGFSVGTVTMSYIIPTGCYTTTVVTVNPIPVPVTGGTVVCVGLSTTLTDAATGGTWSSSNTSIATVGVSTGVVTGVTGGSSVTITYTLPAGCNILDTMRVSLPPTAITGPSHVCAGSTITMSDGVAGGTWTGTPAIFGSVDVITGVVTGVAGGVYTVSYTTQACNAVSYAVSVNPQPSPITGTGNVCVGASTTLSDATPYGTWSISGSSASIMPIGTVGGSSAAVISGISFGSPTAVSYTLSTGCARIVPVIVDSLPAPIAGIDSVCQGFSVTLTDASGGGVWSSSDGTKATAIAATGEIIGTSYGFATITYSLVSGCYQTVPFTVIEPLPASVTITDTPSMAPLCAGTPITFTAHPVNGGTPTYQWELFGMPTSAADTNSVYVDSPTHGDYIVCYMTVHGVCAAPITVRDSIALNIYPVTNPAVTIMTPHSDSIAHFGEEVTFYSDVSYGGTAPTYLWYINGSPVAGATSSSFTTHIYENDTISCIVSGNAPCVTGAGTSNPIYIYASQLGVGTASLSNNDLSLSPNPNTGSFVLSGTLGTTSEPVMIEVSDMLGHIVYKDRTMTQGGAIKAQINLDKNIASGTYLLKVSSSTDNQTFHFVVGGN